MRPDPKPQKRERKKRYRIKAKAPKRKMYKGQAMPVHTATYMEFFGYGLEDFRPSELTGNRTNDIHHIRARKSGGTTKEEKIENLMAVTRLEHNHFGDKPHFFEFLDYAHEMFTIDRIPLIEKEPENPYLLDFVKTINT